MDSCICHEREDVLILFLQGKNKLKMKQMYKLIVHNKVYDMDSED